MTKGDCACGEVEHGTPYRIYASVIIILHFRHKQNNHIFVSIFSFTLHTLSGFPVSSRFRFLPFFDFSLWGVCCAVWTRENETTRPRPPSRSIIRNVQYMMYIIHDVQVYRELYSTFNLGQL